MAEEAIPEELEAAGLSPDEASRLIDRGGGDQARRDVEPGGALWRSYGIAASISVHSTRC